jgi:hypothetical protein
VAGVDCMMQCNGNAAQRCGDDAYLSVYRTH